MTLEWFTNSLNSLVQQLHSAQINNAQSAQTQFRAGLSPTCNAQPQHWDEMKNTQALSGNLKSIGLT